MNTKKGCLKITIVLSIVPMIVGMLMLIFSDSTDEKTLGVAMAVIGPAALILPWNRLNVTNISLTN